MDKTSVRVAFIAVGLVLLPASALRAQDDGAKLFKSNCTLCHGDDGSGATATGKALKAKDLKSDEVQAQSDADLANVIAKGKNKMPAFGKKLNDAQIKSLVAQVRHLAGK